MAWTTPMTAVANDVFASADFNTHVRDNLNETAPAKAATVGGYFTVDGTNSIVERIWDSDVDNTLVTTDSETYVTLNGGPEVSITTGTSAMVWYTSQFQANSNGNFGRASIAVSGATAIAADDEWAIYHQSETNTRFLRFGGHTVFTGLNPGTNVFTMQHETNAAASGEVYNFNRRRVTVMPF